MSIENEKINFGYGYDESNSIAILWSIADVKDIRPDLTDEECLEVLHHQEQNHDASIGVSWDTLSWCADYCFPHNKEISNG